MFESKWDTCLQRLLDAGRLLQCDNRVQLLCFEKD